MLPLLPLLRPLNGCSVRSAAPHPPALPSFVFRYTHLRRVSPSALRVPTTSGACYNIGVRASPPPPVLPPHDHRKPPAPETMAQIATLWGSGHMAAPSAHVRAFQRGRSRTCVRDTWYRGVHARARLGGSAPGGDHCLSPGAEARRTQLMPPVFVGSSDVCMRTSSNEGGAHALGLLRCVWGVHILYAACSASVAM
ncbi:hypothetical protein HYPSUDRAFT_203862 [Hypholoma sublateritium FD-334 SS-4]|uniref:Uncharacterized protein n=1 Tax=Hypholoma sublateritium (strain FD-334 SS-4) TaxID=945553 RepID=A0A0D2L114_HYPSF|nr:hypothetical protein HYPSUDRAFT_203862 [Hypholoma sublateritium FD-334 SS-4]